MRRDVFIRKFVCTGSRTVTRNEAARVNVSGEAAKQHSTYTITCDVHGPFFYTDSHLLRIITPDFAISELFSKMVELAIFQVIICHRQTSIVLLSSVCLKISVFFFVPDSRLFTRSDGNGGHYSRVVIVKCLFFGTTCRNETAAGTV